MRRPIPAPTAGSLSPVTVQAPATGTVTANFEAVGANCSATPCVTGYNVSPDGQTISVDADGGSTFSVTVGPTDGDIISSQLTSPMVCTVTFNITDDLDRVAQTNTTLTIL